MISLDLIFPFSSIGSPRTFIILPKVPSPTGTEIDSPVFFTIKLSGIEIFNVTLIRYKIPINSL